MRDTNVDIDSLLEISFLYAPSSDRDNALASELGERYKPPERFKHGEWTLVATIAAENEDGLAVEVYECRVPAEFYRIVALPSADKSGFSLGTGSGAGVDELVARMALAIADGTLGLDDAEEPDSV